MNPQDRPKAILLVVAVLAVFGFVFFRLLGSKTPAPAPSSPAVTAASPSGTVAANTPGPGGTMLTDEELAELDSTAQDAQISVAAFDPFRKTVRQQAETGTQPGSGTSVPTSGVTGGLGGTGPGVMGVEPPPGDPMAMATFDLIGVVVGNPAFAVLKAGEQTLYLRKGERISKEIVLLDVRNEYVVLRYRKNNYKVLIGEPRQLVEGSIGLSPTGEVPMSPLPDIRQPTSLPVG